MEGGQADAFGKNDRRLKSQEVLVAEKPTKSETSGKGSSQDTTITLCVSTESTAVITQITSTFKVETTESELTDTLASDVCTIRNTDDRSHFH